MARASGHPTFQVRLVMRHKATGRCYAGLWLTQDSSAAAAIIKTVASLDLSGVDVVDQTAARWRGEATCIVPLSRATEYEEKR